jgi:hypothetical protein
MSRLVVLAAMLLASPAILSGCAPRAAQQADAGCEPRALHVRVLDGRLAEERLMLGAATRQHELQPAGNLHLTDAQPDDARADQALRDRQARDIAHMQDRLATHEAALAEARTLAADCAP